MMILLNVLLNFFIVRPLRCISMVASEVSLGNLDAPEILSKERDEIASFAHSFNRMRRSLENALRLLER
jgi:protein-histidine pros-kinase